MESLEALERKYHDMEGKFAFLQWRSEELRRKLDHLPVQILDAESSEQRQSLQEEFKDCAMELVMLPVQLEEMERRRVLALLEWRNAQFLHLKAKAETVLREEVLPLQTQLTNLQTQLEASPNDDAVGSELKRVANELTSAENRYKQADAKAAIFASSVAHDVGVSLSDIQDWEGHARKMGMAVRQRAPRVTL